MDDRTVVPSGFPKRLRSTAKRRFLRIFRSACSWIARSFRAAWPSSRSRGCSTSPTVTLEILDSRTVVPAYVEPLTAEEIETPEHAPEMTAELREIVQPDIFTTGDANLLIEPEEKTRREIRSGDAGPLDSGARRRDRFSDFRTETSPGAVAGGDRSEPVADELDLFAAVDARARRTDSQGSGHSRNIAQGRSARRKAAIAAPAPSPEKPPTDLPEAPRPKFEVAPTPPPSIPTTPAPSHFEPVLPATPKQPAQSPICPHRPRAK